MLSLPVSLANRDWLRAITAPKYKVPDSSKLQQELFQREVTAPLDNALPNEILTEIFDHCSTCDLFQLGLASRRLSSVSSRFLYHTIPDLPPNKFTAFLMSVYFYDHKAPLIRSLTLLPKKNSISLFQLFSWRDIYKSANKFGAQKTLSARHVLHSRLTLFAAVLKKLHNLTSLRLYLGNTDDCKVTIESLLAGCSFQLRVFHSSFLFDQALVSFLQTQPALRDLSVDFGLLSFARVPSNWNGTIPATALSALTTLGWSGLPSSLEVIQCLIAGRPVDSVVIDISALFSYANGEPILKRFMALGRCEEQIKNARIIFGNPPLAQEHIGILRSAFSSLQYLTLHFPKLVQNILDKVVVSIHHFESVQHLVISGYCSYVNPAALPGIAEKCLDSSEALDNVQVVEHNLETNACTILHQLSRKGKRRPRK